MLRTALSVKNIISTVIGLIIICFTFYSLHLGAPWNDEASEMLPTYKFLLGQIPFVDEYNIIQFPALLTFPIFKLFYWINHHSIEGIFIFERRFYTVLSILACLYLTKILCFYIPFYISFLIAVNIISFLPLGVHSPSYDNFALLFFTLGIFSLFRAIDLSKINLNNPNVSLNKNFLICGIWLGLASSIYPPLVLSWIFLAFFYKYLTTSKVKYYLLGLGLGVSWLVIIIFFIGIKHFLMALHHNNVSNQLIVGIVLDILPAAKRYSQIFLKISPSLMMLILTYFFKKKYVNTLLWQICCILSLVSLAVLVLNVRTDFGYGSGYTMALFLATPFLYLYLYKERLSSSLFWSIWLPAFICLPVIADVSGSLGYSTLIVIFSGALVSLIFIYLIFINLINHSSIQKIIKPFLIYIIFIVIAYNYQNANLNYYFADFTGSSDKYCFKQGALKNICTSKNIAQIFIDIEKSLSTLPGQHKSLSVLSTQNAVYYFFDNFIPLIDNAYVSILPNTVQFYLDTKNWPDVLILKNDSQEIPSFVLTFLMLKYHLYDRLQNYSIYTQTTTTTR